MFNPKIAVDLQPPQTQPAEPADAPGPPKRRAAIETRRLSAGYSAGPVIREVSIRFAERAVTAIIGPSGCGKSTLVRCLNRMHELTPGATFAGEILLEGVPVAAIDPVLLRRRVGMVFQRPNPFPTMSIRQNVASGLKLNGVSDRAVIEETVESSLRKAALWDEVKDKLDKPGLGLSGGQQQRLCIARALAVGPDVLLMDEPCSALDPIATARVEELILELKDHLTIVIVTHNMQQAARVSSETAFMLMGELVELGKTDQMFTQPRDKRTEDYITGRFG